MRVTYKPEDGGEADVQEWEFQPGRVRSVEATLVEKQYGKPWDQFCAEVQGGSMKARRVLLWHLMRRKHPAYRFEDTPDFYADEVTVEMDLDELVEVRARIESSSLPEADREQALALIDADITAARDRGEVPGRGKATSSSGG